MLISSGTTVKTTVEILTSSGCWIDKGTVSLVIGIAKAVPMIYLCETMDEFEPEEFCCFADNIAVIEREVA